MQHLQIIGTIIKNHLWYKSNLIYRPRKTLNRHSKQVQYSTLKKITSSRSYKVDRGVLYRRNTAHLGNITLMVVPEKIRREILFECHNSPLPGGPLGFTKTFFWVKGRYYWPNMLKEIEKYGICRLSDQKNPLINTS